MSCVAGVTGSELKKRIVRIMAEQMAHKLDLTRKLLLCLAAVLAVALPVSFGLVHAAEGQAQAAAQKMDIVGTWQGTLHVPAAAGRPGIDLRLVNKITKGDDGKLTVVDYSIDQGGAAMPASSASFQDGVFKFAIRAIDATYEGKLSGDGKSIAGTLTQGGNPLPLLFERATPETEWTIPPPPAKVPPMAANADPSFEVVTVKPSKPDEPGKLFTLRGDHVMTVNSTLMDLICSAYDVQQRQVAGGPSWMDSEKFDIDGKADVPGLPSEEQARIMLQKLLADRFQLKFHKSTKEMSAYLLTVAKGGPKMTQGDATGLPGIFFPGLGRLTVHDATMEEFASVMQSDVLDRPVVDQTGLAGRWNFLLKWTPDESQFGGMGIKVPPPSDAADAPPPLFTAIQEQIGLKLEAGKAQVPVLDIDQVEKPSAN
jgi:uncharacterized protein (TIGR03435 family)